MSGAVPLASYAMARHGTDVAWVTASAWVTGAAWLTASAWLTGAARVTGAAWVMERGRMPLLGGIAWSELAALHPRRTPHSIAILDVEPVLRLIAALGGAGMARQGSSRGAGTIALPLFTATINGFTGHSPLADVATGHQIQTHGFTGHDCCALTLNPITNP